MESVQIEQATADLVTTFNTIISDCHGAVQGGMPQFANEILAGDLAGAYLGIGTLLFFCIVALISGCKLWKWGRGLRMADKAEDTRLNDIIKAKEESGRYLYKSSKEMTGSPYLGEWTGGVGMIVSGILLIASLCIIPHIVRIKVAPTVHVADRICEKYLSRIR